VEEKEKKKQRKELLISLVLQRRCIAIHQRMQLPRLGKNAIQ
jgi:hypothetical protein